MARPKQTDPRAQLTEAEIAAASYAGSAEHKATRWWGGLPKAHVGADGMATRPGKQLTTLCRLTSEADRRRATAWVRSALARGQFRHCDGDKLYPKHIWHKDDAGQHWFGFCINGIAGSYKGWPVEEAEKREIFG